MMDELKTLTEKIGLTSHVKALMKETFIKRKGIIDTSDTISTVVFNFPFLLKAEMILFEFSLRVNLKLSDIFEKIDALIMELGFFLKMPDDTILENRKLNILQKIHSNYKPKRTAKSVQPLFTVKNASSPPGQELVTKETEDPRLVIYVEDKTIVAAFIVADGKKIKINNLSTTKCLTVLLGTYHAWASDFSGPYVSSLSIFDYFALNTPNNYSCKMFDNFKRDFRRWRLSISEKDQNTQPTHNEL